MALSTAEKIEQQRTKMEQMENELKRLVRRQKEEDRKTRTHRICQRGGFLESLLPDTITLTEARFKTFLEKTVANDFGRRALATLKNEQEIEAAKQNAEITTPNAEDSAGTLNNADYNDAVSLVTNSKEPPQGGGATGAANAPSVTRMA